MDKIYAPNLQTQIIYNTILPENISQIIAKYCDTTIEIKLTDDTEISMNEEKFIYYFPKFFSYSEIISLNIKGYLVLNNPTKMFYNCGIRSIKGNIKLMGDASEMFYLAQNLTGDLSNWDVSNVTHMYKMFYLAHKLNCDLSKWDFSNVSNYYKIFS
jgi:surface protein